MAGEIQLNSVSLATESSGTVTLNSSTDIKGCLNASGSAPIYACRAWVNFNGTGTVAIQGSGNVSSITDNGTGDYTINFTTAMPDANYSVTGIAARPSINNDMNINIPSNGTYTTSAVEVFTHSDSDGVTAIDAYRISVQIFR